MSYSHTFRFDELPHLQPDLQHRWVRHKYRKHWHAYVAEEVMIARARPSQPLEHAHVRCARHSSVEPDRGNVAYSFKPILDGFVRAHVLLDDSPRVLLSEEYEWLHAPPKKGHVTVEITWD